MCVCVRALKSPIGACLRCVCVCVCVRACACFKQSELCIQSNNLLFWSAQQSTTSQASSTISEALKEYLPERLGRGGWVRPWGKHRTALLVTSTLKNLSNAAAHLKWKRRERERENNGQPYSSFYFLKVLSFDKFDIFLPTDKWHRIHGNIFSIVRQEPVRTLCLFFDFKLWKSRADLTDNSPHMLKSSLLISPLHLFFPNINPSFSSLPWQ